MSEILLIAIPSSIVHIIKSIKSNKIISVAMKNFPGSISSSSIFKCSFNNHTVFGQYGFSFSCNTFFFKAPAFLCQIKSLEI